MGVFIVGLVCYLTLIARSAAGLRELQRHHARFQNELKSLGSGYAPSRLIGTILMILLILALLGRI
ncbi:MAG: DUF3309 family protein [Hyphomicrobiaceae bacterium]|nr:DUF3309 family protein [Hyphomicrobiaceae bacterium]